MLDWLVDQANLRGYHGAFNAVTRGSIDPSLRLEEIVVGCLMPDAEADARVLKLVTRILQSAPLDVDRLVFLARRERAEPVLYWLVQGVPEPERTGAIPMLAQRYAARPPRGYRPPKYRYDFSRLVKKPAAPGRLRWKPEPT